MSYQCRLVELPAVSRQRFGEAAQWGEGCPSEPAQWVRGSALNMWLVDRLRLGFTIPCWAQIQTRIRGLLTRRRVFYKTAAAPRLPSVSERDTARSVPLSL
ncbi:hypothetical protein AAFF_G00207070 [Aldrovandia affinis]|uniref:Uncharacterized protein n=1 Tax=Aldrovandia affinis TaxID=143900 RepID=A0AAD7RK45_9TELE|nr:hypothetical protein AAFF_G00207070 [Aldrovandia affinis]